MPRVLLVDDDPALREVLTFALEEFGHEVDAHGDGSSALLAFGQKRPDIVITDLKMPGIDGVEVVRRVKERDANMPVIVLTAFGTISDAVDVMKLGADDYLTKPYHRDELRLTVQQALERRRLLEENRTLRRRLRDHTQESSIVHASPVMVRVLEKVRRVAPSDATVLITGESGTGKEMVARALHDLSDRWDQPFVAVNCAAIPHDLMEAELFGHARGAFTGAFKDKAGKFLQADRGTLLLDEIGDLSLELQAKLLRVLETGQIDIVGGDPVQAQVRVVAATNADLEAKARAGHFRTDLYYRLNVIPICVPPLRDRPDDIPALWDHFVEKYAPGSKIKTTPALMRILMEHPWPGNVRELGNLCQRMILLRNDDVLDVRELPDPLGDSHLPPQRPSNEPFLGPLPESGLSLPKLEREVIVRALEKHGGNRTKTAEYLGVPRHVLIYRIEKYEIA